MASPDIQRKLPYLPPETWSKILAEVSYHRDFREFVHLWTQYRRVSSVFKSEIERTLIHQHQNKPTIYLRLIPMLSALFSQALAKSTNMSAEEMTETDEYEYIEIAHSSDPLVPLRFYQLSPNENEITFRYQNLSIEEEWPKAEHLYGKVMLRPHAMLMHTTLQHLPAQVEWVNRNEQVTLSLTFDWKQLFSMFIARDAHTYNQYFSYRRFPFAPPCRGQFSDGTVRMCMEHELG